MSMGTVCPTRLRWRHPWSRRSLVGRRLGQQACGGCGRHRQPFRAAQRMVAEAESAPWLDSAAGGCCGRRCGRPQHHGGQPQPCVGFTAVRAHPWDLRQGGSDELLGNGGAGSA